MKQEITSVKQGKGGFFVAYRAKEQQIPEIRRVTPLPDYRLKLEFTSGSLLILNMADRIGSMRYCPLSDVNIFNSVTTDGWTLFFDTGDEMETVSIYSDAAVRLALSVPPVVRSRIERGEAAVQPSALTV
nr:DUF2442 domain-containing protein [Hungatella hominis]